MTSFSKGLGSLSTDPVRGLTQMTSSLLKGSFVETPVALTEGLRNLPRLYGDKPEAIQPVHDWKSGMTQAGKVSQHYQPCLRPSGRAPKPQQILIIFAGLLHWFCGWTYRLRDKALPGGEKGWRSRIYERFCKRQCRTIF